MRLLTPTEVAVELWGSTEDFSRSWGARKVRTKARELFPRDESEKNQPWLFTPEEVARLRAVLR